MIIKMHWIVVCFMLDININICIVIDIHAINYQVFFTKFQF